MNPPRRIAGLFRVARCITATCLVLGLSALSTPARSQTNTPCLCEMSAQNSSLVGGIYTGPAGAGFSYVPSAPTICNPATISVNGTTPNCGGSVCFVFPAILGGFVSGQSYTADIKCTGYYCPPGLNSTYCQPEESHALIPFTYDASAPKVSITSAPPNLSILPLQALSLVGTVSERKKAAIGPLLE